MHARHSVFGRPLVDRFEIATEHDAQSTVDGRRRSRFRKCPKKAHRFKRAFAVPNAIIELPLGGRVRDVVFFLSGNDN